MQLFLDSAQMPLGLYQASRSQSNLFLSCDEFVKTLKEEKDLSFLIVTQFSVWGFTRKGVRAEVYFRVQNA